MPSLGREYLLAHKQLMRVRFRQDLLDPLLLFRDKPVRDFDLKSGPVNPSRSLGRAAVLMSRILLQVLGGEWWLDPELNWGHKDFQCFA
jgi:hypothetical protein